MGGYGMTSKTVARGVSVGLLLAAGAGCFGDRTTILDPVSGPGYIMRISVATRGLPGGSVSTSVFPTDDSAVVVTLSGLKQLSGGAVYKVWLADTLGTTLVPASGVITVTDTDTLEDSQGNDSVATTVDSTILGPTAELPGGDGGTSYNVRVLQSAMGGANPRSQHFVVVTIESSAGATTPSTTQFLWRRFRTPGSAGGLSFGNFRPTGTNFVFASAGTATGTFREDEFQSELNQLSRPPVGFRYRAYMVTMDGNLVAADYDLGGLTAPYPRDNVSLDDADITQVDEVVLPTSIYRARISRLAGDAGVPAGTTGPFGLIDVVVISLEPKNGVGGLGPTWILTGTVPEIVTD
jgi:hypothetical protein